MSIMSFNPLAGAGKSMRKYRAVTSCRKHEAPGSTGCWPVLVRRVSPHELSQRVSLRQIGGEDFNRVTPVLPRRETRPP